MKNKTLICLIMVLGIITMSLIMPKNVFATEEKEIQKVEIEVPNPVAGERPADETKINVKADEEKFEIDKVLWMKYNNTTKQYEEITDSSTAFEKNEKYAILLSYKRPNTYGYATTAEVTVNGNKINTKNLEEFNVGSYGDADERWDGDSVFYELGEATTKVVVEQNSAEQYENDEKDETPKTGVNNFIIIAQIIAVISIISIVLLNKNRDIQ